MINNRSFFSILQLTDLHILQNPDAKLLGINTDYFFRAIVTQALANHDKFDLVLVTGDLAQEPCTASYQCILSELVSCNIPCICLPGNHDSFSIMERILNNNNVSCKREFVFGNWQVICLNSVIPSSDRGHLSAEEFLHLERCLARHPERNALIAVHHHCIKAQSDWMDTMMIDNSDELLSLLSHSSQVKAVTFGHIHQELNACFGSIHLMGTPSTCFQFKPFSKTFTLDDKSPGYRILRLYDDGQIETEIFRLTEAFTDLLSDIHGY